MKTAGKTEHGHRAERCSGRFLRRGLGLKPREQLARPRIIQLADFFNCYFHRAHAGYYSQCSCRRQILIST